MEAFVYCWTDHKTNMLYIGSHKGTIDDGYICSSKYMLKEFKNRPQDFTREIIAMGTEIDIRNFESRILQKSSVKTDELFYNKHQNDGLYFDGWKKGQFTEQHRKNMSVAASKRKRTQEHIKKLHEGRKGKKNSLEHTEAIKRARKGVPMSKEAIEKGKISRSKNNDTKLLASHAGKISAEKYKNDIQRQINHSNRMKLWWEERKLKQMEVK